MRASNQALIRRARPDEAAFLSGLAFRSKAHWGYPESFMDACRRELTLSSVYLAGHPAFVLEDAQTPIGFYTLERLSDAAVELGYLFVEPACIGLGYGRRLMDHAREYARSLGYRTMLIQGDPHAVPFYRAVGGRVVGLKESASIPGRTLPLVRIDL
jgi:GNAT superfamily N-acetyltransferase